MLRVFKHYLVNYVFCVLSESLRVQCVSHLINGTGSNFSETHTNCTNITEQPTFLLATCISSKLSAFSFLNKWGKSRSVCLSEMICHMHDGSAGEKSIGFQVSWNIESMFRKWLSKTQLNFCWQLLAFDTHIYINIHTYIHIYMYI